MEDAMYDMVSPRKGIGKELKTPAKPVEVKGGTTGKKVPKIRTYMLKQYLILHFEILRYVGSASCLYNLESMDFTMKRKRQKMTRMLLIQSVVLKFDVVRYSSSGCTLYFQAFVINIPAT